MNEPLPNYRSDTHIFGELGKCVESIIQGKRYIAYLKYIKIGSIPVSFKPGSHLSRESGSGVASAISEVDIFIYSCSAQLISFEIVSTSKEINCAEHEYMNMSPSLIALATPLESGIFFVSLMRVNM